MNSTRLASVSRRAFAWGVHLFTASGIVWGLLSILAIYQHQWKLAFWWIAATLIVDGFDGTLARLARVKLYAPQIDGALLDNMVDYVNYVLVPALLLIEGRLVPPQLSIVTAGLILLSSGYQFSQVDAKTDDHYFKGFPSYWNILVVYLFMLGGNPWINFTLVMLCVVLVFVPVKYIYPSRTLRNKNLTLAMSSLWVVLGILILLLYPAAPHGLIYLSLLFVAYYGIASVYHTLKPKTS